VFGGGSRGRLLDDPARQRDGSLGRPPGRRRRPTLRADRSATWRGAEQIPQPCDELAFREAAGGLARDRPGPSRAIVVIAERTLEMLPDRAGAQDDQALLLAHEVGDLVDEAFQVLEAMRLAGRLLRPAASVADTRLASRLEGCGTRWRSAAVCPWPITGMALSHASGRPNTWATNCGDWGPGMAAGMSVSPEELRVTVKAFEAAGADEPSSIRAARRWISWRVSPRRSSPNGLTLPPAAPSRAAGQCRLALGRVHASPPTVPDTFSEPISCSPC
jgi:hypothetical protein